MTSVQAYSADPDGAVLAAVRPLYAEIYAEPPYLEGPTEVGDFVDQWPTRAAQPGFRVVLALGGTGTPLGFALGHALTPDTDWWDGLLDPVPAQVTAEHTGRTYAMIEIAVRASHRRAGVGRTLHRALLAGRPEQRATLLSRPEAAPAQAAYAAWGYRCLGRLRPAAEGPVYLAMIRDLPL